MRRSWLGVAMLALCAVSLGGCGQLPQRTQIAPEHALSPAQHGTLADYDRRIEARLAPGDSAYWLLDQNRLALDARLLLTDSAVSSLDIQYFIWQQDATGNLLAAHLLAAADRGVKVRLLLDDFSLSTAQSDLLQLDSHPNIEVRVFNPWVSRRLRFNKGVEFLFHMGRLNRRMHNKTYIADGRFAIMGGRNIGDRYFGLDEPFVQDDLDVLLAGKAADEVVTSFDEYWNSRSVYQVAVFTPLTDASSRLQSVREKIAARLGADAALLRSFPLEPTGWSEDLDALVGSFAAGPAHLLYDPPDRDDVSQPRLYPQFKELIGSARREVLICSPYFIPDADFRELIRKLVARGVRVAILTNSLATNNHAVAHTAYKHWRREVLAAGAELYELREGAAAMTEYATPPAAPSELGLHSKIVLVDDRLVFIGSPNVDPRSMVINTEIGVIGDSDELARRVRALIERDMAPRNAWRVTMDDEGWLTWSSGDEHVRRQPAKGFGQRFIEFLVNLFPLKKQA